MIISDDDAAKLSSLIGKLDAARLRQLPPDLGTVVYLRENIAEVCDELRGIRDRLALEPDIDDDLEELLLVDIIPLDGAEPDEEHIKLMESFEFDDTSEETEDASLAEFNKLLAKCTRPARAEFAEDEEDDEMRDEQ